MCVAFILMSLTACEIRIFRQPIDSLRKVLTKMNVDIYNTIAGGGCTIK